MLKVLSWPFMILWRLLTTLLGLTGRAVALVVGLVLLIVGGLLNATGIGAILGVPLMVVGGLLVVRGLF